MAETGASSMRELPTLTLFKINMNLEMEKGHRCAGRGGRGCPAARARRPALRRDRRRGDPGPAGSDGGGRAPLRRGGGRARDLNRRAARQPRGHGRPQDPTPGRRDPLPPPRRLLRKRDGRLEGPRGRDHARSARGWPPSAGISHCYQRPTYEDWPYSVFTMAHGRSKEECDAILDLDRRPSARWVPTTAPPFTPRPSTRRSASTTSPTITPPGRRRTPKLPGSGTASIGSGSGSCLWRGALG